MAIKAIDSETQLRKDKVLERPIDLTGISKVLMFDNCPMDNCPPYESSQNLFTSSK